MWNTLNSLIVWSYAQIETTLLIAGQARQYTIEDMIVAFTVILGDNAGLLQQVLLDLGSLDNSIGAKMYVNVFAKPKDKVNKSDN